jgi:molecular chaperone DnaK (HSP70)
VADPDDHSIKSFADRARSAISHIEQDERVKQTTAAARTVAAQAEDVSKTISRQVAQEDAWEELRGDVELLTEIARAQHALILDLIDRVAELEAQAGGRHDG